jgi:tetratricopeptide (TPR) repeat protein
MTSTVHSKLTEIIRKGKACWYRGEYEVMLGYFKALSLVISEPFFLRRVLINLGVAYQELNRSEEAIDSYRQALEIKEERDENDITACRQNLGNALMDTEKFAEALALLTDSEKFFRESQPFTDEEVKERGFRLGTTLETKARALHALGDKSALDVADEAEKLLFKHCREDKATGRAIRTKVVCWESKQ